MLWWYQLKSTFKTPAILGVALGGPARTGYPFLKTEQ